MAASKIVTISKKIPLFKGDERANSIELVEFQEVSNQVVTGIGMYEIGEKVLFIEPDYCIPDDSNFEEYYRPNGDPNKSKLGINGRIRAVKFTLHKGNGLPVYSYGIIPVLSDSVFQTILDKTPEEIDNILNITKADGEEDARPAGMYKTEVENITNVLNNIKFPIRLIGSQKIDGNSITIYVKKDSSSIFTSGIMSRDKIIPLTISKVIGVRNLSIWEKVLKFFGKRYDTNVYEEVENDSIYIQIGKPYLEELEAFCKENNLEIALRGELNGMGLRGSGNKNNPSTKEVPNIKFFGADHITGGIAYPMSEVDFGLLVKNLRLTRCPVYFTRTFRFKSELLRHCNNIFQKEKDKGNLIEGIVVRTLDSTFSAKIMSLEYDSKK